MAYTRLWRSGALTGMGLIGRMWIQSPTAEGYRLVHQSCTVEGRDGLKYCVTGSDIAALENQGCRRIGSQSCLIGGVSGSQMCCPSTAIVVPSGLTEPVTIAVQEEELIIGETPTVTPHRERREEEAVAPIYTPTEAPEVEEEYLWEAPGKAVGEEGYYYGYYGVTPGAMAEGELKTEDQVAAYFTGQATGIMDQFAAAFGWPTGGAGEGMPIPGVPGAAQVTSRPLVTPTPEEESWLSRNWLWLVLGLMAAGAAGVTGYYLLKPEEEREMLEWERERLAEYGA